MSSENHGGQDVVVQVRLDALLLERQMSLTQLSESTGITMANLSILKNNKAKAIRMTTIATLCKELRITPGDLLDLVDERGIQP